MIDSEYLVTEDYPSVEDYLGLRQAVDWSNPTNEIAAGGLRGSLFCVCIRHADKLVGFGRVIGDGCFTFYIQDVIVHPDHQRKGLGTAVMQNIMSYIRAVGGENACVGLMSAGDRAGFYEQFGFSIRPDDAPGMECLPAFRR